MAQNRVFLSFRNIFVLTFCWKLHKMKDLVIFVFLGKPHIQENFVQKLLAKMILFNQIGIFDQEWLWKESNNVLCFLHKNSHKEMVPSKSATFIWVWSCKLKPEFHFGSSVGVPNERLNFSILFFKLQFITQRFWLKTKMLSFSQLAEPYISNLINLLDF